MRKLRADTELTLSLLHWRNDPKNNAARLKAAAENYLTDPETPEGLRRARPYTERLAHAALKCADAPAAQLGIAMSALSEVEALAAAELKAEREADQARERAAQKRAAVAGGDLPAEAPKTRWDERADLK